MLACVLITHFPMKAERLRSPELRGRQVIVTQERGSKQVVLDSSAEAIGVIAGMSLQEALSRCKGAALLQADAPYYQSVFDRLVDLLLQRSPVVEKAELGRAYVGLDGLTAMYGSQARLIDALLKAAPHEMNPRIGVAQGKFPAYVAAVASDGGQATRVPDDVAGFMRKLPVDLLPIAWGKKDRMHRFGLHTLGQLAHLPVGALQSQFGHEGKTAWELANGVDRSPLLPHKQPEVVSEFLVFPSPATTLYAVMPAIEILLGRAFASPALRGKYVRKAWFEARVMRKPPWTKTFAFKEAVSGKPRALSALKNMMETVALPGALEDIKMTLSGITGESGVQAGLFSDMRKQDQLRETVRQLEARLGARPPIYQVRDVEPWSRIPERRQALIQFDP